MLRGRPRSPSNRLNAVSGESSPTDLVTTAVDVRSHPGASASTSVFLIPKRKKRIVSAVLEHLAEEIGGILHFHVDDRAAFFDRNETRLNEPHEGRDI